jgi:trehalose 2-sulfotransferase
MLQSRYASGVLGFLGLGLPAGREITARHRRLADELNAQWIERYRREARERMR